MISVLPNRIPICRLVLRQYSVAAQSTATSQKDHNPAEDHPTEFNCKIPTMTVQKLSPVTVPFSITDEQADALFRKHHQRKILSPRRFEFRYGTRPTLVYVPFLTFDVELGYKSVQELHYRLRDRDFSTKSRSAASTNTNNINITKEFEKSTQVHSATHRCVFADFASYEFRRMHLHGAKNLIPKSTLPHHRNIDYQRLSLTEELQINSTATKDPLAPITARDLLNVRHQALKDLVKYLKTSFIAQKGAAVGENLMISELRSFHAKTFCIYVPFYYYENYWNAVHLPTYVHGVTGEVWSPVRVISPTISSVICGATLFLFFGTSPADGSFQIPELFETIDAFISGITVGCASWFYPQLKLIGIDDKRIEELDSENNTDGVHTRANGNLQTTQVKNDRPTSAAANDPSGPNVSEKEFEEDTLEMKNQHKQEKNDEAVRWESANEAEDVGGDRRNKESNYSTDEARQAMLDALRRLDELKRRQRHPPRQAKMNPPSGKDESAGTNLAGDCMDSGHLDPKGYYRYLGLRGREREATVEEIRMAFRRMARVYHPDLEADPASKQEMKIKFQRLVQVYSILRDADKRRAYDSSNER